MNGAVEHSDSLALPMSWLCDPANWSYVSEQLDAAPGALQAVEGADSLTMHLLIFDQQLRYKQRLGHGVPLAALVSPSAYDDLGEQRRDRIARAEMNVHSFGVEREQVAIINPECFRYFERRDGWGAKFTIPGAGFLLSGGEA